MQAHDFVLSLIGDPRLRVVIAALANAVLMTACLMVPYDPPANTEHVLAAIPDPERLRLSVGPRRFLEDFAEELARVDRRLGFIEGQTFIDTAAPSTELTLAHLLQSDAKRRIEPLDVDFLVLIVEPETVDIDRIGSTGPMPFGFLGASKNKRSTSYWAAIIDTRRMQLIEQLTSESVGSDAAVGLGVAVGVMSDTDGSARKELIRQIAAVMAASKNSGSVRFVPMAIELIPAP